MVSCGFNLRVVMDIIMGNALLDTRVFLIRSFISLEHGFL